MPRSLTLIAAGVVAVLALSGCGPDDPKPNYSSVSAPPSSSTPTPSTSNSPTGIPSTGPNVSPGELAPTEPAEAGQNSQEGALAFVSYYVKTVDWVYATSRPDLLSPFFASTCTTCLKGQSFIQSLVEDGSIKGGRVTTKQIGLVQNDGRGGAQFAVSANLSVAAAEVVDPSGATATSFPATPDTTLTEWIAWRSGHWTIIEERYA